MALNLEVSNKAPALPIDLTDDLMDAFEIFSGCYGGLSLGQASMKALQCIPLAWACLAIKESSKMSKDARDREASRCYQEVALPGWIKVCNLAIEQSGGSLRFPAGWQTRLYYTTLGGQKKKGVPSLSPKTFMQKPAAALARFKTIKKEFTKGPSLWFDANEVPDTQLPSGETRQPIVQQFHAAMYKDPESPTPTWEETEYFARGGGGSGPREGPDAAAPASGAGTGAGTEGAAPASGASGAGAGAGEGAGNGAGAGAAAGPGGHLNPLAAAALGQWRAHTRGAAPALDTGAPVPRAGASPMSNEITEVAAAAAASARREAEEDPGSAPGEEPQEDIEVPSDYCYPYILMAGAWGRRERCPAEWKYLTSSDGPSTRSKNGEGDAVVGEDSCLASKAAMDRACPNGDPVSRRKAAAYREAQDKKAAKEEADKENAKRAAEEAENKRKRLEVLKEATAGMTNVAASLAKMAAMKEEEQQSAKRQRQIKSLKDKIAMGLRNEAVNKQKLEMLLDEEEF